MSVCVCVYYICGIVVYVNRHQRTMLVLSFFCGTETELRSSSLVAIILNHCAILLATSSINCINLSYHGFPRDILIDRALTRDTENQLLAAIKVFTNI